MFYKRFTNKYLEETESVILNFRVPLKYKILYSLLTKGEKRIVKETLKKTIETLAGKEPEKEPKQPLIMNINVVKTEVKNIAMDPEVLVERINTLKFENRELKDIIRVHKRRIQELEAENRELLKTKKKYLDLKQKMQLWLTWLKKGYTNYVLKEIEKVIA